jgi:tetratricopeptide (TPR) repeat protein
MPSALRVTAEIFKSLGLFAEAEKYPPPKDGIGPSPRSQRIAKRREVIQLAALQSAQHLALTYAESATAWCRLAQAAHNVAQGDQAAAAAIRVMEISFRSAVADGKLDVPAVYSASSVLASVGRSDTAEFWLEQLPPNPACAVLRAAFAVERHDFDRSLELVNEVEGPTARSLRAWLLLRAGQPAEALHELRALHRTVEPRPETLSNMAYAYAVLGASAKAVRAARHAVALAPMDQTLSFKLVGYFIDARHFDLAHHELDRLTGARGPDGDIALTRADIYWESTEYDKALLVLRKAQADTGLIMSVRTGAEIGTNVAVLRNMRGEWNRTRTLKTIDYHATRAGGRSIGVVSAFAGFLLRSSEYHDRVASLIDQAGEWHDRIDLLPLRARLAHLRCQFRDEIRLTAEWARHNPLDETAMSAWIYLEGALDGRYREAANRGLAARRQFPHSRTVLNNTAYCLAMAGDGQTARDLLARMDLDRPAAVATAGLVQIANRDLDDGLRLYQTATDRVARERRPKDDLVRIMALLALNQRIILRRSGYPVDESDERLLPLRLPVDWRDFPSLRLQVHAAQREGIAAEAGSPAVE